MIDLDPSHKCVSAIYDGIFSRLYDDPRPQKAAPLDGDNHINPEPCTCSGGFIDTLRIVPIWVKLSPFVVLLQWL